MGIEDFCPRLNHDNHQVTSGQDTLYNCVAWTLDYKLRYIWPDTGDDYGWPEGIPREPTLRAFVAFYHLMGFAPSPNDDGRREAGIDKIAIYVVDGLVEHVALQKPNGHWTSKIGDLTDIEHVDLAAVGGGLFGEVGLILRRRRPLVPPPIPPLHPPPSLVRPTGVGLRRHR